MRSRQPRSYDSYTQKKPEEPEALKAIRGAEKVMCEHCGSWVDSTETKCPNCGAPMEKGR